MVTESIRPRPQVREKISVEESGGCEHSVRGAKLKPQLKKKLQPQLKPQLKQKLQPQLKPQLQPQLQPQLKPKLQPQLKLSPKPKPIETITSDSESEEDEVLYERWINGEQLLISMDNKYIYDPESLDHIGTVVNNSNINWIN